MGGIVNDAAIDCTSEAGCIALNGLFLRSGAF